MSVATPDAHLSDGDLVRLLDGEAGSTERTHVDACTDCDRRFRAVARRSAALSSLLREADWGPPARLAALDARLPARESVSARVGSPWLRAAAVAALVVGTATLVSPVRAWVVEWVAERWAELVGEAPARGSDSLHETGAAVAARVRFVPSGDELSVELAAAQTAGALELRLGDGREATVEVVGAGVPAELLVLPGGVRVGNDEGWTVSYRLTVPPNVRRVRVAIGGRSPTVLAISRLAAGHTVDLRAPVR